jgi:hypothetical protein
MNFCLYFFSPSSAQIASFFISPWLPLLLSLAGFALLVASLYLFSSSARLLSGFPGKMISASKLKRFAERWKAQKKESRHLKAEKALLWFRVMGPKFLIAFLFFILGYLWRDHQVHSGTVDVVNAVVESQAGLSVIYHYLDDPSQRQHTQVFCAEPSNRVPHFKPGQIIASMKLIRGEDCERVYSLDLRRRNGVAILAGGY